MNKYGEVSGKVNDFVVKSRLETRSTMDMTQSVENRIPTETVGTRLMSVKMAYDEADKGVRIRSRIFSSHGRAGEARPTVRTADQPILDSQRRPEKVVLPASQG